MKASRRFGENPQVTFTKLLITKLNLERLISDRGVDPVTRDKAQTEIDNAQRHIDMTLNAKIFLT